MTSTPSAQCWESIRHEMADNPHKTAAHGEAAYYVEDPESPADGAMLERALWLNRKLAESREQNAGGGRVDRRPTLRFKRCEIVCGNRHNTTDTYERDRAGLWPETADEITVTAERIEADGEVGEVHYKSDLALIRPRGIEHRGPGHGATLAIVTRDGRQGLAHRILSEILFGIDALRGAGECADGEEIALTRAAADATAHIALGSTEGILLAAEKLTERYVCGLIPRAAHGRGPITIEIFRNGSTGAIALPTTATAGSDAESAEARRVRQERDRNRAYYEGTVFQDHPGIEIGRRLTGDGTGRNAAIEAAKETPGATLKEPGSATVGTIVTVTSHELAAELGGYHAIVWTNDRGTPRDTEVHVVTKVEADTVKFRSTSVLIENILSAAAADARAPDDPASEADPRAPDENTDSAVHNLVTEYRNRETA